MRHILILALLAVFLGVALGDDGLNPQRIQDAYQAADVGAYRTIGGSDGPAIDGTSVPSIRLSDGKANIRISSTFSISTGACTLVFVRKATRAGVVFWSQTTTPIAALTGTIGGAFGGPDAVFDGAGWDEARVYAFSLTGGTLILTRARY